MFDVLRPTLGYLNSEQLKLIEQAYIVADAAHSGQLRRTGEPYITHPLAVATILAQMHMDSESIIAGLLHDVLEDTPVTKQDIQKQFGDPVAELVDGVSKLTQIKFENRVHQQAENFRKMLLAMSKDIRVIIVKLADRLHNMRTLGALPYAKRCRITKETLEIYAPIAHRLGMHNFRIEFEDLGFAALHPWRTRVLNDSVRKARGNRKEITSMIDAQLKRGLQLAGISQDVLQGREKHLYSIYKKMQEKHVTFSQIMDFYAFRIIVQDEDTCYRVLGIVHRLFKPVPNRFKDYIAIPKANQYQSLHTTLFGPYGVPIEIQIRTEAMHAMAEVGIAAHWRYKNPEASVTKAQARASVWVKNLLEMQKNTGNSLEFMQNVKVDLFPDEVYVFTPRGDIIELPTGATAVDLAYAVHTDIGNSCVAARIERHLSPLSTPLENGQTIEIITAPGARPNPAWLHFVTTAKARGSIRHFLKTQQQAESIVLGKRLLETALTAYKLSLDNIDKKLLEIYLKDVELKQLEDLFAEIGIGDRSSLLIAKQISDLHAQTTGKSLPVIKEHEKLAIKGTEGMIVNFAKCCWPIPGDPIIGYLGYGQGLTVHTENCPNLINIRHQQDRCVHLRWEDQIDGEFNIELKLEVINGKGILAVITNAIANEAANIDSIRSENIQDNYVIITLIIAVTNRYHLAKILRRLRKFKNIQKISRVRGC